MAKRKLPNVTIAQAEKTRYKTVRTVSCHTSRDAAEAKKGRMHKRGVTARVVRSGSGDRERYCIKTVGKRKKAVIKTTGQRISGTGKKKRGKK